MIRVNLDIYFVHTIGEESLTGDKNSENRSCYPNVELAGFLQSLALTTRSSKGSSLWFGWFLFATISFVLKSQCLRII